MINDRRPAEDLDQVVALLHSVNSDAIDLADFIGQWTRQQWSAAFEVRNAITASSPAAPGVADFLRPTRHVPRWLRDTLNETWFMHPGSSPAPSWLISSDHRIDWFALADEHPELILDNPCTQLISPTMMREAVVLARARNARVIIDADLGSGREVGIIVCRLSALYISTDHDPTLVVDMTEIFGGITPDPTSGPGSIRALNTTTDPETVYFGWNWSAMSWPDQPTIPSCRRSGD